MAKGEVTEKGNAFLEATDGLHDVTVLFEEFGVDAIRQMILNWERWSWWLLELMVWPRIKRVGSLLVGKV